MNKQRRNHCTSDSECPIDGHTKVTRIAEWNKPPLNGQKITTERVHIVPDPAHDFETAQS